MRGVWPATLVHPVVGSIDYLSRSEAPTRLCRAVFSLT